MAEIKDTKTLMLHCMDVNCKYMRLPSGHIEGYENLVALYDRIASQLRACAAAWVRGEPCPEHEPAADAFIWAVVAWADAFGISLGAEPVEWGRKFVGPHADFAEYMRPLERPDAIEPHAGLPAETIIELDVRWMVQVMKLTAKWGMLHHLKDMPALHEAQRLEKELRSEDGATREAYLRSDLKFFQALFKPFPFKPETMQQLKDWLAMADPDNK